MISERRPGSLRGWSEVWNGSESKINSASRKVKRLVNSDPGKFENVSFSSGEEKFPGSNTHYKKVSVEPNQAELEAAPRALKRILKDLGIKPEDKVSIELYERSLGFDFTVKPGEVTEDRLGMTLSTNPCRTAIFAPIKSEYKWTDGKVVTDPFVHGIGDNPFYLFKGERTRMVKDSYEDIFKFNGNDIRSWNPNLVNMLTEAANWGAALVTSRKNPDFT